MIISVNWLKQFTQIDASIDELVETIGARLVEIESIKTLGDKYKDVVIVRVVECDPVVDSDHLNLTKIDDGGVVEGVDRDEHGHVQVVCGAPNVRKALLAAWLPPGSTVPNTFGTNEPFVLGSRSLRGHMSNGMLASARELDLFDDHEGIVEIDKDVAPGTPFASPYALDDTLLDIENKSLTHRPDTFGMVGFAREVAAIAGKGFMAPTWLENLSPSYGEAIESVALTAAIDEPELCSRYQAVALGGINKDARTPLDIQTYLSRSGVRPISLVVDVTNYLMLLTGQPLHAFDYDKVVRVSGGSHLHVRHGYENESLALLDGRNITLSSDDIVIAAGDTAVALAGAMGGVDTEIDETTSRIIIESATFNLYNLRRTQMRHGIFSEAITRFTKGQPAALTAPVLAEAVAMLGKLAGVHRISDVADDYPQSVDQPTINLSIDMINNVLGSRYAITDAAETLLNVQFTVETHGSTLGVTAGYWRTDIHIAEDVIEEIGRLNGFDSIEPSLPHRDFTAVAPDKTQLLRQRIRSILRAAGANEILTYSFVHGDLLRRAAQTNDDAYALENAISPDLQYYRLSLTPSLLDKVSMNQRQKYDECALFEFAKTHSKDSLEPGASNLPAEHARIAMVYSAIEKRASGRGSAYYTARQYVDHLLRGLHTPAVCFRPLDASNADKATAPFEPKRSASVYVGDVYIGIVGEYKRSVQTAFKLPPFSAGFELLLAPLESLAQEVGTYVPLSRFPSSDSDITFLIPAATPYNVLTQAIEESISTEAVSVTAVPRDIYQPDAGAAKNITIRFTLVSYQRTLTREDVNGVMARIGSFVIEAIPESKVI